MKLKRNALDVSAEILKREFLRRKERNPHYSLRAFALFLGLGIATLSDAFSGKRRLSKKNKIKILERLQLDTQSKDILTKEKDKALTREQIENMLLADDTVMQMDKWYHYALLEIPNLDGAKSDIEFLARTLGINKMEVKLALERLLQLRLLEIKRNKISKATSPVRTSTDIPSRVLREIHRQMLQLASLSLDRDSIDKRCFFNVTMSIDPTKIAEAKKMMQNYAKKVAKKLESGKRTELYALSLQLFPLKGN